MEIAQDMKAKLATMAVAGLASLVISKAVDVVWKLATGKTPPGQGDDGASVARVVVFAGISAMAVALGQHYATKKTDEIMARKFSN